MTFIFSKTTPATGSVAMYTFKEHLKTAGWTVPSSSDATTYNAAGDQITSGSSGAGGLANNSAWFILRSPDGVREFVFQRGTTNTTWRVKYSRAAKFSGGSPAATQVPSATDEVLVLGTGTDAAPGFRTLFTTDGSYRWNIGADNASPYGFWAGAFPSGGGVVSFAMILDPLTGTASGDGDTHLFIITSSSGGGTVLTSASISSEGKGETALNRAIATVANAAPSTTVDYSGLVYQSASGVVIPNAISTNPLTAKDETFPIVWARRSALANPGYKGVGTILKWNGTTRTTGDTFTITTSRDRIIYADCNLPWDGTLPSV